MRVIFVNYRPFQDSSGIHIFFLANALERHGVKCTVCVPWNIQSVYSFGEPLFETISFTNVLFKLLLGKFNGQNQDGKVIIHAWTPREIVRWMTLFLARMLSAPYVVHLEDNEESILEDHFEKKYSAIENLPQHRFIKFPLLINPKYYKKFLVSSAGITCIISTLERFVPSGVTGLTFWPACEASFFSLPQIPDKKIRQDLGIMSDEFIVTYTGNMHQANRKDIENLYLSIGLLNNQGVQVRLLRTGSDYVSMSTEAANARKTYAIERGNQPPPDLIKYIAVADILVQPGRTTSFDEYRFPSKLPMFFASARPVVLPVSNIGINLQDGVECLHLRTGSPEDIASKISKLLKNRDLARNIGMAGREFARANFSWEKTAHNIEHYYEKKIQQHYHN